MPLLWLWVLRHPANIRLVAVTTNRTRIAYVVRGSEITISREDWYKLYLSAGHILP